MFLIVVGADQVRDVRPEHVYARVITRKLQFFSFGPYYATDSASNTANGKVIRVLKERGKA